MVKMMLLVSERVENTLGKGRKCWSPEFFSFHTWFSKVFLPCENTGLFPKQALVFTCLQYKSFENTVGKGDIAHNEQFLLFPQFSFHLESFLPFSSNLKLSSANSFILERSQNCHMGKG